MTAPAGVPTPGGRQAAGASCLPPRPWRSILRAFESGKGYALRPPAVGQAGPRTSLLPLICAPRSCPRVHPSRSTYVLGGRRHRLRCSRPRPAGLARQRAPCLPADRTRQRPAAKCSAPPPPAQDHTRAPRMPGRRQGQQHDGEPHGGAGGGDHGAEKAARLPAIDGMDPPQRQAPHGPGGKPPCARTGTAIEGDSKRVTLIQNAAKARTESKPKGTRRNDDKGRRNPCKKQKAKKPEGAGHVKYPGICGTPAAPRLGGG